MNKKEILTGLAISLFVAVALSPFASSSPDGLEKVAEHLGFMNKANELSLAPKVMPDYQVLGIAGRWSTSIAGFTGTLLIYCSGYGVAYLLSRNKKNYGGETGNGAG